MTDNLILSSWFSFQCTIYAMIISHVITTSYQIYCVRLLSLLRARHCWLRRSGHTFPGTRLILGKPVRFPAQVLPFLFSVASCKDDGKYSDILGMSGVRYWRPPPGSSWPGAFRIEVGEDLHDHTVEAMQTIYSPIIVSSVSPLFMIIGPSPDRI